MFTQGQNHLATHFSEHISVLKRCTIDVFPAGRPSCGVIQSYVFSPPASGNRRPFFFASHCEDLAKLLEVELPKVESALGLDPLWLFSLRFGHTECQRFVKCCPGFPTLTLAPPKVSARVNCESLCPPACLSNIQVSVLPCDFPSLRDLRGVFDFFQIVLIFLLLLGRNEAAYMPDWNQRAQYCTFMLQMMKLHCEKQTALPWITAGVNGGTETQPQGYLPWIQCFWPLEYTGIHFPTFPVWAQCLEVGAFKTYFD